MEDTTTNDGLGLVKLGQESDRARRACERIEGITRVLEAAVRRSLPYLVRRKTSVTTEPVRTLLLGEMLESLSKPRHVASLRVGARGVGALILDGNSIARGLDGVLGGRGDLPVLDELGLTAAQTALSSRLARGLVAAFDEVLTKLGVKIEIAPELDAQGAGGLFVACVLMIGDDETAGRIALLLPTAALDVHDTPKQLKEEPLAAAAMQSVEVEIVAELGRVRMQLARLATLKVGDVVRLPLPVDTAARLHVGGRGLYMGRPTTRGTQIAITIDRHGD